MAVVKQVENRWSTEQLITGIEIPEWLKLLAKNRFKVDPVYLHRAAWITGWSLPATLFGRLEDAIYGKKLATMEVDPTPIFLLGHWRTGTTHLHNLLQRDPHHTSPTYYQVVFPGAFLLTGDIVPRLAAGALAETRSYDNVKQGWHEAAEDEIALAKLTGLSIYCSFMFPETAAQYEKYVDFLEATPDEKARWKAAFVYFIKKIMLATGKRVVVKSCTHTARVRLLLEMFPDAKFVHIHRNPYETFSSTLHLRSKVDWENFFQKPEENFLQQRWEQTATIGQKIWERIIEDRKLIPPENFVELNYHEFEGHELEYLRGIYEKFRLPEWERYEKIITPYLESLKGYKKNKLKIDEKLMEFVYDRWRIVFDTYGYKKDYVQ
jgi:hypothetical protein